jgi:hypothetical protein
MQLMSSDPHMRSLARGCVDSIRATTPKPPRNRAPDPLIVVALCVAVVAFLVIR